jgi:hypothetical protein
MTSHAFFSRLCVNYDYCFVLNIPPFAAADGEN